MISCFYNYREINDAYCDSASRPESITTCNFTPCPFWSYSDWSPCSSSCGPGEQHRDSSCRIGNTITHTDKCFHLDRESLTRSCYLKDCQVILKKVTEPTPVLNGTWEVTGWSECSENCGKKGIHTRRVYCAIGNPEWPIQAILIDLNFRQPRGKLFCLSKREACQYCFLSGAVSSTGCVGNRSVVNLHQNLWLRRYTKTSNWLSSRQLLPKPFILWPDKTTPDVYTLQFTGLSITKSGWNSGLFQNFDLRMAPYWLERVWLR